MRAPHTPGRSVKFLHLGEVQTLFSKTSSRSESLNLLAHMHTKRWQRGQPSYGGLPGRRKKRPFCSFNLHWWPCCSLAGNAAFVLFSDTKLKNGRRASRAAHELTGHHLRGAELPRSSQQQQSVFIAGSVRSWQHSRRRFAVGRAKLWQRHAAKCEQTRDHWV